MPFVIGAAVGNGAAIIATTPRAARRPGSLPRLALATIMSSNYAVVGLAMAAAGVLNG